MGTRHLYTRSARVALAFVLGVSGAAAIAPGALAAGPCDAPANPIVTENCLPGSPPSQWDVTGAGDPSIQGFATQISVNRGDTVHFKVKTDATAYGIDIYRLGYYGGNGARLITSVSPTATLPQTQPACLNDSTTGLIDCGNWAESAAWAVPADATSGVYLAKLHRTDTAGASHIVFIVRNDASHSDLLFQTSDTTWQAYNSYGGNSLYTAGPTGAPPVGRAYKVSYNRPFNTRDGTPEDSVFNAEFPMIRWLEANGYDTSYVAGADVDRSAAMLQQHKVFMSVGHDEYWSGNQRTNVEAARDAGVHLAFFSGNEIFWKTRWEASIDGTSTDHRTLVSYKETHAEAKIDPSPEWTGTWRDPLGASLASDGGRPENALSGTIFTVNCCTYAMQVPAEAGDLRFWRNTTVASATGTSTLAAGTLGYEWDEDLDNGSRPEKEIDLSSTTENVQERITDQGSNYAPGTATHSLTLHRVANALVFAAGTVQWSWGLDGTHDRGGSTPSTAMRQATVNLFADMGVQPGSLQAGLTAATASTDTDAPTATTDAPASDTVPAGTAVTITGTAADTGGGRVGGVEVSTDGTTWHPASGRDAWSYTFTPSAPGALSIRSRATDDSLNTGAASAAVSLTVTCPCSLWNDTVTPANPGANDNNPINVGTRFTSDVDGTITALRFYKGAANSGVHTGHLYQADGTLLATQTFTNETASGWQQVALDTPVPIIAGRQYVVSYYSPSGFYAYNGGYFLSSGVDSPPLHAPPTTLAANGLYDYGAEGFPTSTFNGSNYWVDVVLATGPDTVAPVITARTPAPSASNVALGSTVRVQFNEVLDPSTVTNSTVQLRDGANALVPAAVTYDSGTRTATLTPDAALTPSTTYTVTVHGGAGGVADSSSNVMAADVTWSFTSAPPPADEGPGGPILVVTSTTGPFGRYLSEILKAEGLNEYLVTDISHVTPGMLAGYGVVVLGEMPLSAAQATTFSDFVTAGGNLIAMHPDPDLAGLLGITSAGTTLSDGYLQVNTATPPGKGITGQTIQFHGSADRYTLSGATAVATLFSNATTATPNPAVTLRNVGGSGGQAGAFTYDLARSVVETRQGNPAWAAQERDSITPIRSDDLFFGAASGDVQPDWVNLNKVQIPQADEQQRLLANMILQMEQDRAPLPRFWYLPHGAPAAVVLTGDDHANGGTAGRFDAEAALSPAGCSVANWECVRSTSFVYEGTPITDTEAAAYNAQGFEVALHVNTNCEDWDPTSLEGFYSSQLDGWHAKYASLPGPVSNRTHCITWSDYDTQPQVELQHGIRFDTNYYYWPGSWIQDRPGLFTGSGFPQRFATAGGDTIDVYQAATQMTDESDQTYPATIDTLLDNALGPLGYYGAFTANIHTDTPTPTQWSAIVNAAQTRHVPLVSARQMLTWIDGRNASSFGNVSFAGNVLGFTVTVAPAANGLQAMLPAKSGSGATLTAITRNSAAVPFTTVTRKGIDYVAFDAASGTYAATYTADTTPPVISALAASPTTGGATIAWTTDEPADSKVMYGTAPGSLTTVLTDNVLVTAHSRTITGLTPGVTYYYKVSSTDAFTNVATAPPAAASFAVPSFVGTDTSAANFNAGTLGPCRVVTRSGDGELTLTPTVGSDFNGSALPAGWVSSLWNAPNGSATVGGGLLTVDGAFAATSTSYTPGHALEFVATFQAAPFQHVGFAVDLNGAPWAIFSTGSDGASLKARTNDGSSSDSVIPGNWFGVPHRYRIDWSSGQVVYSIDGTVVATHTANLPGSMRPAVSDASAGGPTLGVDWLDMSPYTSPCAFQSRTFDAGSTVHWTTLDRAVTVPFGTGVSFETRTSANGSTWTPFVATSGSTIASPDNRYLQYRATLTGGAATPSLESVSVNAIPEKVAPTSTMLVPSNNAAVHGNAVTLDATAADNVGVTGVEFRATGGALNDTVIGTGTFTAYGWVGAWNTTTVSDGSYAVVGVARDAAGNTRSAAITVKVDNTAPSTSMLVPANGASVRGTAVVLDASAADNVAVTRVEFRATGGSLSNALIGTGTASPYGWIYTWNTDPVAQGTYTMRSVAFDAAGNSTTSAPITVRIDRTAPTTAIIVPSANGATLRGNATVDASASDNVGVTKVEFRATGGSLNNALVATGALTPYGWIGTWNTAATAVGTYTLKSVAFDAAGNSATSAGRTVKVAR